jgi:hypothetical protein
MRNEQPKLDWEGAGVAVLDFGGCPGSFGKVALLRRNKRRGKE